MARQKEHLAQQQIAQRMQHQMHHGAPGSHAGLMPGSNQLHHHSSAQSLHSQPSFGSMTSPSSGAFQPSPVQAPQSHQPGFFDHSFRGTAQAAGVSAVGAGVDNLGHIREEEIPGIMDRLTLGNRAAPGQFGAPGQPFAGQNQLQSPSEQDQHDRQVQQMLQDRARLQQEQIMHDAAQASGAEQAISNERLQQFQQLQSQGPLPGVDARFQPAPVSDPQSSAVQSSIGSPAAALPQELPAPPQELTLTEQVQKAASAQQSPVQPQFGLPRPFPPAPSQSPLPAPAAQRHGRQSVADQLQTEERDLSQTPSVDTPSAAMAPWAKETIEAQKGPSLKEIQEAEAKKAAEEEAALAAARRAAFEKEMEAQSQAPIPAPGLPATASWANSGSPSTPTGNGAFAWAKAAQKTTAPTPAKSMAQIQKEEEARKKKLAAAAATAQANAMSSVATAAGGKSYANLAGKVTTPPVASNQVGGAWTTVGAGGKPKTPAAVQPPTTACSTSSGIVPTMQSNAAAQKKPLTRSTTTASAGSVNAHEEFRKWAVGELRPDLNKGISGKFPSTSHHLNQN
jgi:PERQ amino acid-rich with GYF domain-containing protein